MKPEIVDRPDHRFEDQRTIAATPWRASDFESYLGATMVCYVEDGLGDAKAVFLRLPSGRVILAKELCEAPIPRLFFEAGDDHDAALADVLSTFPLGLDDYLWTLKDGDSDEPADLYREDDNGVRFHIGHFESLIEARLQKHELESSAHKQHYWIERRSEQGVDRKPDHVAS